MHPLRFAMVGGGKDAFIGAVHRMAIRLDGQAETIAGALSSTPERSMESGRALGFAADRIYPDWRTLVEREAARKTVGDGAAPEDARVDAVAIVTPNHLHADVAIACLEAGLHVVLDKPMTHTLEAAEKLFDIAERARAAGGPTLTITYNYSGYPLTREARELVRGGAIGTVRKIYCEYHQGWLSTDLAATGQKQASWRVDPKIAGAGALGDIGTHTFQLAHFITGLMPAELTADVTSHVDGRVIDDDAAVLMRYETGARGVLTCSQVCSGEENAHSIRIYGDRGSIAWHQENPNRLELRSDERTGGQVLVITRGGGTSSAAAAESTRIPPGHPEGFIEAFANIYRGAFDRIRGVDSEHARLAPDQHDGIAGMRFIHAALASARDGGRMSLS